MYGNAIIMGEVEFPRAGVNKWHHYIIEADHYDDWPDALSSGGIETTGVAQALHTLHRLEGNPGGPFLDLEYEDDRLTIRGFLEESEFARWGELIASVTRAAGEVGGVGQLLIADADSAHGTLMVINRDEVDFEEQANEPMSDAGYGRVAQSILTRGGVA